MPQHVSIGVIGHQIGVGAAGPVAAGFGIQIQVAIVRGGHLVHVHVAADRDSVCRTCRRRVGAKDAMQQKIIERGAGVDVREDIVGLGQIDVLAPCMVPLGSGFCSWTVNV